MHKNPINYIRLSFNKIETQPKDNYPWFQEKLNKQKIECIIHLINYHEHFFMYQKGLLIGFALVLGFEQDFFSSHKGAVLLLFPPSSLWTSFILLYLGMVMG